MKSLVKLTLGIFVAFLISCGDESCPKGEHRVDGQCLTDDNSLSTAKANKDFEITGAVSGAFKVKVDGDYYDDIEAFYSAEKKRLPKKIAKAGYADYSYELEGNLGLDDLANDMIVFLAPRKNRGYASKSYTFEDGSFLFELPPEAAGDVYRIKAVKRVNLTLQRPDGLDQGPDKVRLCYNFAALQQDIKYDAVDKPVVLDTFETSLTEYDCELTEDDDGLELPEE